MNEFLFFTGTHKPHWLWKSEYRFPWFVSHVTLSQVKNLYPAKGPWAEDSGGFSMLSKHGTWDAGPAPEEYAEDLDRHQEKIGNLLWAAPQDWMCEPQIVAKTGLTVLAHQKRTIHSVIQLRELTKKVHIIPVLQGQETWQYVQCAEMYRDAGIDLMTEPVVGVGSVCRRQKSIEAAELMTELHGYGFNLHGFGFKMTGLQRVWKELVSADSLAWSFDARWSRRKASDSCTHKQCQNCDKYAAQWRGRLLSSLN